MSGAVDLYKYGDYAARHPDWHLADAPTKADDLVSGLSAVLESWKNKQLRIADVGAGVGAVLMEVCDRLRTIQPDIKLDFVAFEISPQAVSKGRSLFPQLDFREKVLEASDGPFETILFVDVLEHVENPWDVLRVAAQVAEYLVVRQPLLENFSTFRHRNYRNQREEWGHIGYFSYYSFLDMAEACGWRPLKIQLLAPWELSGSKVRGSIVGRALLRTNRVMASHFLSGFYLNGAFKKIKPRRGPR